MPRSSRSSRGYDEHRSSPAARTSRGWPHPILITMAVPKLREVRMSEANESDQIEPFVKEGFHIHDAASANWVVRKVVEARQYAERVQAWADRELRRAKREEEFFRYRFGEQLEQ